MRQWTRKSLKRNCPEKLPLLFISMVNWSWELNLQGWPTNHLTTTPTLLNCYCWEVKWPRDRSIQLHFSMAKIWALRPTNVYVTATALLLIRGGGESILYEKEDESAPKQSQNQNEKKKMKCRQGNALTITRAKRAVHPHTHKDHAMMVALRFDPRLKETLPTRPSSDACTSGCLTERTHCYKHRHIVVGGGDERFTAGDGGLSHDGHGCGWSRGQTGILPTPHLGDRLDLRVELDALLTQRGWVQLEWAVNWKQWLRYTFFKLAQHL